MSASSVCKSCEMTICILILQFAQTLVAIAMRMTLELALHSNKKIAKQQ